MTKTKFLPQLPLKFRVIFKVPGEIYMDLHKKEKKNKISKIFEVNWERGVHRRG